mmetsp:Transcript_26927/g.63204  ORF Transcript_26927/g.63204 Transcript_26927/m.63204 type:complete len:215 (-) Transcript_26927:970-1614(-)
MQGPAANPGAQPADHQHQSLHIVVGKADEVEGTGWSLQGETMMRGHLVREEPRRSGSEGISQTHDLRQVAGALLRPFPVRRLGPLKLDLVRCYASYGLHITDDLKLPLLSSVFLINLVHLNANHGLRHLPDDVWACDESVALHHHFLPLFGLLRLLLSSTILLLLSCIICLAKLTHSSSCFSMARMEVVQLLLQSVGILLPLLLPSRTHITCVT